MESWRSAITAGLSLSLTLALAAGCWTGSTGRSSVKTRVGDRTVQASLDGTGSISVRAGVAVISCRAGTIRVAGGSVELNDQEIAKVSEKIKKIDIDYTAGTLTVKADGETITSFDP